MIIAATGASTASAAGDVFDRMISSNTASGGMEPQLAVDPANPDKIAEIYQAGALLGITSGGLPDLGALGAEGKGHSYCDIAYSHDGGQTWTRIAQTLNEPLFTSCGDPFAAGGSDGTLYVGAEVSLSLPAVEDVHVLASRDGGRTWAVAGSVYTKLQAINELMHGNVYSVFGFPDDDRPWMAADESNGHLFVTFTGREDPDRINVPGRRYVFESADGGAHWSEPRPFDNAQFPDSLGRGTVTAGGGTLAAAYTASAAPGGGCPCGIFETSTSGGRTWTRRVVARGLSQTTPSPYLLADFLFPPYLAGDPARPGRYALLYSSGSAATWTLFTTSDAGRSWSAAEIHPQSHDAAITKPWLGYSPHSGALGIGWRELHPNTSADFYATVSTDNGHSFMTPRRMNSQTAPAHVQRGLIVFDDASHVVLTDTALYAAWGDVRGPTGSSVPQAWFGRWTYAPVVPATTRCVSRRSFRIRLRVPKGVRVRQVHVLVNRRRVAVRRGKRLTAPVDLRGLPRGRFTVRVTLVLADGGTIKESRRYRTCLPR